MVIHLNDRLISHKLLRSARQYWFLKGGLVRPALLNMGHLLGVGAWRGLPNQHKSSWLAELRANPPCAADIIVSILYQHSRETLRDFFCGQQFVFAHRSVEDDPAMVPQDFEIFAIRREGALVKVCT